MSGRRGGGGGWRVGGLFCSKVSSAHWFTRKKSALVPFDYVMVPVRKKNPRFKKAKHQSVHLCMHVVFTPLCLMV